MNREKALITSIYFYHVNQDTFPVETCLLPGDYFVVRAWKVWQRGQVSGIEIITRLRETGVRSGDAFQGCTVLIGLDYQ